MINYRIEIADLHAHLFKVTLTVAKPCAKQHLSLPVWIPGSYLVRLVVRDAEGKAMAMRNGAVEIPF